MLGGAMRQAGVLAAAALVSLDEMIDRLPEDHQRAQALADTIAEYPAYAINFDTVQTNLVIFKTVKPQDEVIAALKDRGVLASSMGDRGIRMVTHYQITDEHIDRTVAALKEIAHA
jgi:threonine aldolase